MLDGQQRLQSLHSLFKGAMVGANGKPEEAYFDPTAQIGAATTEGDVVFQVRWSETKLPAPWFRIRDLLERHQNGNALEIADTLNDEIGAAVPVGEDERKSREKRVRTTISQLSGLLNHDKYFLVFDAETYDRFRTERRSEIWTLLLAAVGSPSSV